MKPDSEVPADEMALWIDVGKLLTAADSFCASFTDHADRCRACTANWQTLKAKIAAVRSHLVFPPQEASSNHERR